MYASKNVVLSVTSRDVKEIQLINLHFGLDSYTAWSNDCVSTFFFFWRRWLFWQWRYTAEKTWKNMNFITCYHSCILCRLTQKREVYCKIRTVFLNRTRFITVSVRRPLSEYRTLLLRQAGTNTFALVFRSTPLGHIPTFFFCTFPSMCLSWLRLR